MKSGISLRRVVFKSGDPHGFASLLNMTPVGLSLGDNFIRVLDIVQRTGLKSEHIHARAVPSLLVLLHLTTYALSELHCMSERSAGR